MRKGEKFLNVKSLAVIIMTYMEPGKLGRWLSALFTAFMLKIIEVSTCNYKYDIVSISRGKMREDKAFCFQ